MRLLCVLALGYCLFSVRAESQQQAPALDVLLGKIYAYADDYRATLPSISCSESIVSQELVNGKVKREMRVEGVMREIRTGNPEDAFHEEHQFLRLNGKPVKNTIKMPYFIQGGFANLIGFLSKERRDCFDYKSSLVSEAGTVLLEVRRKSEPPNAECRKIYASTHWTIIANTASGRILHSERMLSPRASEELDEAYFAALDYAPVQFGERTFWLPAKLSAHDAEDTGRMEATYSNCHRYTGEMRILP